MAWLADRADERAHPQSLWPEARTVIALGLSYAPDTDPLATLAHPDRGTISVYARNRDYHDVIKGMLKHLAAFIASRYGPAIKVFVDTAPVMEKPLAQQAGLGWQGKHTNMVSAEPRLLAAAGGGDDDARHPARRAPCGPLRHLPPAALPPAPPTPSRPPTNSMPPAASPI